MLRQNAAFISLLAQVHTLREHAVAEAEKEIASEMGKDSIVQERDEDERQSIGAALKSLFQGLLQNEDAILSATTATP